MLHIYVLDRGFVVVGERTDQPDKDTVVLKHAAIVRRWGTSTGLGELAYEGPRPRTVLDHLPTGVQFIPKPGLPIIPCNKDAWSAWVNQNA